MINIKLKEHGYSMETEFKELFISTNSAYGFRPFELMVASVAGCSLGSLEVVLTKMRINFSDINVSVKIERNKEKANRIEEIDLHFTIKGEDLRQEKVQKAVDIARKNCAMVQSIQDSIQVSESFEII